MSLSGLRDELKTALTSIVALKGVYDVAPESIAELPAAYVLPIAGDYDLTAGGATMRHLFDVVLLVRSGAKLTQAQDELDGYIDPTGSGSIKAAIEAGTYTHADAIRVTGYSNYGGMAYAGVEYIGARFRLEAYI